MRIWMNSVSFCAGQVHQQEEKYAGAQLRHRYIFIVACYQYLSELITKYQDL
ncbi:hypothetical protein GZH46_02686 [Fragariocoptes setiger]|uniref:Uncharacterized protein n=1 Tax=Fragariocoptes setiger TaxID=1670756 RepID=A0ABQ7S5W9_9ACAR|nr:hypothetical protein GZH46_02686 [Fragariocoptes setiger]